jgi:multidrug efflux pump subunit AcrB
VTTHSHPTETAPSRDHWVGARLNEKPTVFIAVYQSPGSNALQADQEIGTRMAELAKRFPKGIAWGINYDTTTFVSASCKLATLRHECTAQPRPTTVPSGL